MLINKKENYKAMETVDEINCKIEQARESDRRRGLLYGGHNLRELREPLGPNLSVPTPRIPYEVVVEGGCCTIFEDGCFLEVRKSTPEERGERPKSYLDGSSGNDLPF